MSDLVDETKEKLIQGNLDDFGKILDFNWNLKKAYHPKFLMIESIKYTKQL